MSMPCTHEFGIIAEFDTQKEYNDYEPRKYDCISVDDDLLYDLLPQLSNMKTYFHTFQRSGHGLAYTGVTLIPPESLPLFYDVVTTSDKADELQALAAKIGQAIQQNKYMIHYGL